MQSSRTLNGGEIMGLDLPHRLDHRIAEVLADLIRHLGERGAHVGALRHGHRRQLHARGDGLLAATRKGKKPDLKSLCAADHPERRNILLSASIAMFDLPPEIRERCVRQQFRSMPPSRVPSLPEGCTLRLSREP